MVTSKEIVDFSVEYICKLFETNGDKRGVLHERIIFEGEENLLKHFKFPLDEENIYCLGRLFRPAYWIFRENYALQEGSFPSGDGEKPRSNEHYWRLKDGILYKGKFKNKNEFKSKVLEEHGLYLEANLEKIQSSL
ncbi:hypothetical protein CL621_02750 [archaeon]|nr:hypothetical protein [archaeon]|tara:strand:+ start:732 stop:1139 length:408 start_codon:yes stop_codon:yes gene_type:complete